MSIAVSPTTPNGLPASPFHTAVTTAAQALAIQLVGVDRERLTKAYTLALTPGAVKLDDDADGGLITTASGIRYVLPRQCPCEDFQRHGDGWYCKHILALELTHRAHAALVPMADITPATVHCSACQATVYVPHTCPHTAGPALPEAPVSCNVRVQVQGHEVQWTLRGVDEREVAQRLAALLAQYATVPSATPTPPPAVARGLRTCPVHGAAMRQSHKGAESWWSHRTADGEWCKGK